jgi:hypothetical protein
MKSPINFVQAETEIFFKVKCQLEKKHLIATLQPPLDPLIDPIPSPLSLYPSFNADQDPSTGFKYALLSFVAPSNYFKPILPVFFFSRIFPCFLGTVSRDGVVFC